MGNTILKLMTDQANVERFAIRAILLTPDHEILLLRIHPPNGAAPFWITPGGGQDPGESHEDTLRRELMEELGLQDFTIGPIVWLRQHTFNWAGNRIRQREQYHIVHTDRFEPVMTDAVESQSLDRFHWWRADDLNRSEDPLTPVSLASIVSRYLAYGAPTEPLVLELLVD
ncbi:MAG: hypothetical protein JWQ02_1759 [Capsulimonas sp.]|jgi:8-oxo-dGTP pyrophosphatase MutT (NUDIX family)|nr:hypothetical protein [Capsulimonas sp.]